MLHLQLQANIFHNNFLQYKLALLLIQLDKIGLELTFLHMLTILE